MFETEAAAWREVARLLVEDRQGVDICTNAYVLLLDKRIGPYMHAVMYMRVRSSTSPYVWEYRGSEDDDHREARCLAALWFALEAEEDAA